MRAIFVVLLALLVNASRAQLYPYADVYAKGTLVLADSTVKEGELLWTPHQNQKLRYRPTPQAEPEKYTPEEISSFSVDTFTFVPLQRIDVWAENAAVLGKTSKVKHAFAQRLHAGAYTVHVVFVAAYDGVSGAIQTYPNLLFQRNGALPNAPVPLPLYPRLRDERYEKTKQPLYTLFADEPLILEHLHDRRKEDGVQPLLDLVRATTMR